MSNQEREHESLVFRITEELATYIVEMERRLDNLSEQFNNRPELQQLTELKDTFAQLDRQLSDPSTPPRTPAEPAKAVNLLSEVVSCVDEIQQQPIPVQPYEYQLVFERSGSRAVLMEALELAQERLIIVCPWLNRNSIDTDLIQKLRDCLNRNCRIDIGWGHLSDRHRLGKGWRYNALKYLRQLEQDYPERFTLKLLGTHEKFMVCDSTLAMLGSHNVLTSSTQSAEREVGIRTTDPNIIQGLINRFDGASVQDARVIDESLLSDFISLNDAEALDAQDISDGYDFVLVNPNEGEADPDIDNSAEDERGTAVDAEEFLRRYKAGESDFTGINLAGVDLSGVSLNRGDVNLSKANLTRAKLSKANLNNTNLSRAKLSEANLIEASLTYANLTGADLRSAKLTAANLNGAKLVGTNLNGAGLIQANLHSADLSEASLNYTNLTAAQLRSANLMKASLKGTNLAAADLYYSNFRDAEFNDKTRLSGANLSAGNLAGQNLQKMNMSGVNMSGANLCAACLCFSNLSGASLTSADLRGADLSSVNLEKANLEGANLSGANLDEAKLSGATMPDGTVHD